VKELFLGLISLIIVTSLILFSMDSRADQDLGSLLKELQQISKQQDTDPLVLDVPEIFDYSVADQWNFIQDKVVTTTAKNIVLNITGFGGYTNLGTKFTRAIQAAQAQGKKVTMVIVGSAYSLHAYITCYADAVKLLPGAALMFHQPYSTSQYIFSMITFRNTDLDPASYAAYLTTLEQCKAKGVLTKEDINSINDGKDVTIANVDNVIAKVTSPDALSTASTISDICMVLLYATLIIVFIGLIKKV
jgi:hypothetical protein